MDLGLTSSCTLHFQVQCEADFWERLHCADAQFVLRLHTERRELKEQAKQALEATRVERQRARASEEEDLLRAFPPPLGQQLSRATALRRAAVRATTTCLTFAHPPVVGERVILAGTTWPDVFDGLLGTVVGWDAAKQQCQLEMDHNSQPMHQPLECLFAVPRTHAALPSVANEAPPSAAPPLAKPSSEARGEKAAKRRRRAEGARLAVEEAGRCRRPGADGRVSQRRHSRHMVAVTVSARSVGSDSDGFGSSLASSGEDEEAESYARAVGKSSHLRALRRARRKTLRSRVEEAPSDEDDDDDDDDDDDEEEEEEGQREEEEEAAAESAAAADDDDEEKDDDDDDDDDEKDDYVLLPSPLVPKKRPRGRPPKGMEWDVYRGYIPKVERWWDARRDGEERQEHSRRGDKAEEGEEEEGEEEEGEEEEDDDEMEVEEEDVEQGWSEDVAAVVTVKVDRDEALAQSAVQAAAAGMVALPPRMATEAAVAKVEEAGGHGAAVTPDLAKGTRLELFWEDDGVWYAGCVTSCRNHARGYLIRYDDGQRQWERLEQMNWRRAAAEPSVPDGAVKADEEAHAIAILEQPAAPVRTRSTRHDVKVPTPLASPVSRTRRLP